MQSGGKPVAAADTDMRNAVQLHSCQSLTPETATSTHYFFQQSHRAGEGDGRIVESIYESLVQAFNEDRDMISAQARNIALQPDMKMLPLAMDAAVVQFRKLVAAQLAAEQSAAASIE